MSSLRNRNGIWYIQWREDGRTVRKSLDIEVALDKKGEVAKQRQRDFDSAQAKQVAGLEDKRITVRAALDLYLKSVSQTTEAFQHDCRVRADRWVAWLSSRRIGMVDEIQPEHIQEWIDERSQVVSSGTVQLDLFLIRAAARCANKTRKVRPISVDSWPMVRRVTAKRPDRIGAYSASEVERILKYLRDKPRGRRWDFVVECLAFFGCRWGELEALTIADVHLESNPPMVRLESKKTKKSYATQHRFVEIHPRLVSRLSAAISGRGPAEPVFPGADRSNVIQLVGRACKDLVIQWRRLHGFRHFWISEMLQHAPLPAVMAMAGHRQLSTTQRYMHLPEQFTGFVGRAFTDPKTDPKIEGKQGFLEKSASTSKEKGKERKARNRAAGACSST